MVKKFNKIIEYIENHLDSDIDKQVLEKLSTYSYAMLERIFSILCGYTLGEYIRLRRLSKAAVDLREGKEKVIDIALKYGYSSGDAFSYAFKKYHSVTPCAVRKGADFRILPPIRFSISVKGGKMLDIRIEEKKGFNFAGVLVAKNFRSISMRKWQEAMGKLNDIRLKINSDAQYFGACFESLDENVFHYMLGNIISDEEDISQTELEILKVPASMYAVVKLIGPVPDCIHEGWKYITDTFFPQEGYRHAETPDFEVYSNGDMGSQDYEMELWIPIKKEK